jgi:hypothetical protein
MDSTLVWGRWRLNIEWRWWHYILAQRRLWGVIFTTEPTNLTGIAFLARWFRRSRYKCPPPFKIVSLIIFLLQVDYVGCYSIVSHQYYYIYYTTNELIGPIKIISWLPRCRACICMLAQIFFKEKLGLDFLSCWIVSPMLSSVEMDQY